VPDVAGDADPATGYQIFQNGKPGTVGGTSVVAPLMAGLIALINERLKQKFGKTAGFINPLLYSSGAAGVFRDVVTGDNDIDRSLGLYKAGHTWDACPGSAWPMDRN
jgi:kumamolisin